mmetsp:Transcript_7011/g.6231  ORF Transcript_7011/g.6231 Transcript_7011/m.6231 type:complete len:91 (-) Transcript_7011:268-540(-)
MKAEDEEKKEEKKEEAEPTQPVNPNEIRVPTIEKVTKDDFQKKILSQFFKEITTYVISNIFLFAGYELHILEIIQQSLELQNDEEKKVLA